MVGKMSKLNKLDISHCEITDEGLSYLTSLKQLRHLIMSGCSLVSLSGLEAISNLLLTALDISECNVDDTWMPLIAGIKTLEILNLSGNPRFSNITCSGLNDLISLSLTELSIVQSSALLKMRRKFCPFPQKIGFFFSKWEFFTQIC